MSRDLRIKFTSGIAQKIVDVFRQKIQKVMDVEKAEKMGNIHYVD